jgi:magnesium chelatase subunit ChlD-like protein
MLKGLQLARVKGLLMQIIQSAYERREDIAIIGFAGTSATIHLRPTLARPLTSARVGEWLAPIRGGGGTPLSKGVSTADSMLAQAARNHPGQRRWLWLLTDGRTTDSPTRPLNADVTLVVDCEHARVRLNRCCALADRWNADYLKLSDFEPTSMMEHTR